MTINENLVAPRRGPGRPRKVVTPATPSLELPNENPDIDNATQVVSVKPPTVTLPVGIANLWHKNKYHDSTYAMVIPFSGNEPGVHDWCRLIIRVQVGGAGSAVALEGTEMIVADALKILNDSYIQSRLTKNPF
jgi:hypothetical protein